MKRLGICLFIGSFVAHGLTQDQAIVLLKKQILTLDESLERAYKSNPSLLASEKEVQVAKAHLSQARSLFYPKVDLNLNYIRYRNETLGITPTDLGGTILEAPLLDTTGARANPLADNLYLGRLEFRQPLFTAGRLSTTYKLSKAKINRADSRYINLKKDIEFETKGAFYSILVLQKEIEIVRKISASLDELPKGNLRSHDVLSLRRARHETRQTLSALEEEERERQLEFLKKIGMELFRMVDLEGSFSVRDLKIDVQTLLTWAKQNRVDLKEAEIAEEVDQLSVDLSKAERYPFFFLGGGYEVRNRRFPLNETNWNAVLSMNIPLFDGFSRLGRVKENRYRAEKTRFIRVDIEDQVEKDVRSAFNEFHHWKNELETRAQELRELGQLKPRYLGRGSTDDKMSEKVDYLVWLMKAQQAEVEAQYRLSVALAKLERSVGRPVTD